MVRALLGALESKAGIKVTVSHVDFMPSTGVDRNPQAGGSHLREDPHAEPCCCPASCEAQEIKALLGELNASS